MPATEDDLFKCFDALGVAYAAYRRRPVFTVAESSDLHAAMSGAVCGHEPLVVDFDAL